MGVREIGVGVVLEGAVRRVVFVAGPDVAREGVLAHAPTQSSLQALRVRPHRRGARLVMPDRALVLRLAPCLQQRRVGRRAIGLAVELARLRVAAQQIPRAVIVRQVDANVPPMCSWAAFALLLRLAKSTLSLLLCGKLVSRGHSPAWAFDDRSGRRAVAAARDRRGFRAAWSRCGGRLYNCIASRSVRAVTCSPDRWPRRTRSCALSFWHCLSGPRQSGLAPQTTHSRRRSNLSHEG